MSTDRLVYRTRDEIAQAVRFGATAEFMARLDRLSDGLADAIRGEIARAIGDAYDDTRGEYGGRPEEDWVEGREERAATQALGMVAKALDLDTAEIRPGWRSE